MDRDKVIKALKYGSVEWRKHALERMLERGISRIDVKETLKYGEIIEEYKRDKPFESALFFYTKTKPLHVVASLDETTHTLYIITAYIPTLDYFEKDFKTRR